jgi:ABC-type glycerol-3-phosphate transport system substrate-binding protein
MTRNSQPHTRRRLITLLCILFVLSGSAWAQRTKVTFWTWVNLEPAVAAFEAQHPDIDVEIVTFGPWDLHDKLLTALAAGTGAPDLAQLVIRRFDAYRETGQLVDLTPYVTPEYRAAVPDAIWTAAMSGDRILGLPTDFGPGVVWYRRDLFEQFDIEVPIATWDDFIEAGKRIVAGTNGRVHMMPLYVPSGQWGVASFAQFLHSRGGNFYDADGSLIRDNALLADTLRWYYDLAEEHEIAYPVPWFTPSFWALVEAGRFATLPANTAEGRNIQRFAANQEGQWGIMPWPKWAPDAPERTGIWGGNVLAIPAQSRNQEAAAKFATWLTGTVEGQVAYFENVGGMPVFAPARETPRLQQPEAFYGGDVIAQNLLPTEPWYWFSEAETTVLFGEQIDLLFEGQVDVEEAIRRFEAGVTQRLGR